MDVATPLRRPARGIERDAAAGPMLPAVPHVIAWNLTRRCNLACAHCYIAAGGWHTSAGELTTAECLRIADEILETNRVAMAAAAGAPGEPSAAPGGSRAWAWNATGTETRPAPMFILSGGEPLLREDLEEIAAHAVSRGATVVVGTNGTRLTAERIASLEAAGVTGVAISVDSLDGRYHDRFRHGDGALADTLAAVERLREQRLDFVIQTTVTRGNKDELPALAAWAAERGAVSFNVYFLVATGRGAAMPGLTPPENEEVLSTLVRLQREYRGRMMVRSKCQPQIMRHVYESDPDSPLLDYATRCPCGVQYCRITPEGKVTPCPYTPVVAGDLRRESFSDVWMRSPVFRRLRGQAATATNGATGTDAPGGRDGRRADAADRGSARPDPQAFPADAEEARARIAATVPELGGKCGRCEYRRICGGCRARAYATTGDLLGADESCAYEPDGTVPVIDAARPVAYGMPAAPKMRWSPEARRRLERVPGFVRGVVTARIEAYANEHGHAEITPALMDEVRRALPVEFSKRLPFFLRGTRTGSAAEPPDPEVRTNPELTPYGP
ncbi:MAG TPA: radical SAM protein [Longimicrobiales bacterium]